MDQADYEALKNLIDKLTLENKQLRRANSNLKYNEKRLGRVIKKLKDELSKERKPHYKNGRRGSKFNG
jgi:regulator of replication initiation timing